MSIQINGFDGKPNNDRADIAVHAVSTAKGCRVSRWSFCTLRAAYQFIGAPDVNTWMQSSKRSDFISKNQTTDGNATSYGCAMLFIYYLYSQLGFSLPAIINKAGGTREKTYHALTGKNGGYKTFTNRWQSFSRSATPLLPFDNPFPSLDDKARDVYVTATESRDSPPEGSTFSTATFHACGRGPTSTNGRSPTRTAHLRRACNGFGQSVYNWKINGTRVPSPNSGFISVNATVIWNETYQGHIVLIIEADVSEFCASQDVTSSLVLATLDAQKLTYEKQYYKKTWRTAVLARCINSVRFRRSPHG